MWGFLKDHTEYIVSIDLSPATLYTDTYLHCMYINYVRNKTFLCKKDRIIITELLYGLFFKDATYIP